MNSILKTYLDELELPYGHTVAIRRFWNRLCVKYWPSTVLRHKAWILAVLERARGECED